MNWCRHYREQGIEGLEDHRQRGNRAKLTADQLAESRERAQSYQPRDVLGLGTHTVTDQHWTIEDLAQVVSHWYGVSWDSRTSYQSLFARCGFSYQRTEKVYKSRRAVDVLDFEAQVKKD